MSKYTVQPDTAPQIGLQTAFVSISISRLKKGLVIKPPQTEVCRGRKVRDENPDEHFRMQNEHSSGRDRNSSSFQESLWVLKRKHNE